MSEIHSFYRDNPYPERKWVAIFLALFFLYYGVTRFALHQSEFPDPYDVLVRVLITLPLLIGAWLAIGRLGYSPLYRILLPIPLIGFLAAIVFLILSARKSRLERDSRVWEA